jgi:cytochrome c oxidase subunit 1
MLIFLYNFVYSLLFARIKAPVNPWSSLSVEWTLPSPVPVHNFDKIPVFTSDPYGYGEPSRPSGLPAASPAGGSS